MRRNMVIFFFLLPIVFSTNIMIHADKKYILISDEVNLSFPCNSSLNHLLNYTSHNLRGNCTYVILKDPIILNESFLNKTLYYYSDKCAMEGVCYKIKNWSVTEISIDKIPYKVVEKSNVIHIIAGIGILMLILLAI